MKKIYVITGLLFLAVIAMARFYFKRLNTETRNGDSGLYAATSNSALIFCFQNDKSILDILKSQDLFSHLLSSKQFKTLCFLKEQLVSKPEICNLFYQQNIYFSFIPTRDKQIDFLISTQLNTIEDEAVWNALKSANIKIEGVKGLKKITFPDRTYFYFNLSGKLILISNALEPIINALKQTNEKKEKNFVEYIKSDHTLKKNSLANLFINFNLIPGLVNVLTTGINGDLNVFNKQNAYTSLSYNFSKEKLLFNGSTTINDPDSYYNLFSNLKPKKITIDNMLPFNTATYTIYTLESYNSWRMNLKSWLSKQKNNNLSHFIENIRSKYRLNLEETFPKYAKDQFITFQLRTSEKLGAVNLLNGDKLTQQLIDLSEPYNNDIKLFKESDLLYYYFGEPFKKFKKPYYTIIDNYMVFSNNANTVQDFLNNYKSNHLLINTEAYNSTSNQLSETSTLLFYINNDQFTDIARHDLNLPYYKQYKSESGLNVFKTFNYQLSGDGGKFQTNLLLNTKVNPTITDTLSNNIRSDNLIKDILKRK